MRDLFDDFLRELNERQAQAAGAARPGARKVTTARRAGRTSPDPDEQADAGEPRT